MTRKLAAEFFGTFWLVLGGCGAAVLAAGFPEVGIGFVGVAFAFGLTVLTMAYAVGHISGGHFNPAVSLGLAVGGRFSWSDLPAYWGAQVAGAIVAAAILFIIASGQPDFSLANQASRALQYWPVRNRSNPRMNCAWAAADHESTASMTTSPTG